jgi:hypothetical protein
MKKFVLVVFLMGLTSPLIAQDPVLLSEVVVTAVNYKYLSAVDNSIASIPVKFLEKEAAMFKAEGRDLYVDNFNTYEVSFYIPDGKIAALYDGEGNILKTIERFENVQLPEDIKMAVKKRFPEWNIVKDVYEVKYSNKKGAKMVYKLKLKNGDKTLRVKMDQVGNYL